jgi:hypothetical protein
MLEVGIIVAVFPRAVQATPAVAPLRRTVKGAAARLAALGPDGPPLTARLRCAGGSYWLRGAQRRPEMVGGFRGTRGSRLGAGSVRGVCRAGWLGRVLVL